MNTDNLSLVVTDGVAVLTLNRPDKLNSLNLALMNDMRAAFAHVNKNTAIRALVTTGAGRAFCTGADLSGAAAASQSATLTPGQCLAQMMDEHFNPIVRDLQQLRVPTVAALNGIVAGGGVDLALAHDIVVGARSADFRINFTPRLAIVPDMGSTWFLPRLVGQARAMGLAAFGDKLPAETAAQWGLIWQCVEDTQLQAQAMALAQRLANGSTGAYRRLREGLARAATHSLDEQLDWERDVQGERLDTADSREGVLAFLQKREPRFTGS